jgi:formamidopyrimidine-DNA glycosylase
MPELPDVEQFKRYLSATGLHRRIARTELTDRRALGGGRHTGQSPKALRRALEGSQLSDLRRHGKWLFVRLSGGGNLALHFGMTGHLAAFGEAGDPPRHTRLLLRFEDGGHLAYVCQRMLGEVAVVHDAEGFLADRGIGPDALELDREGFRRRVGGRRGSAKSTLMNQGILAGLGNVYADETLFQARVNPKTRMDRLSDERMDRLFGQMRRVLTTSVERGADARDLPARWLCHRREAGRACPRCGRGLRRVWINQRSTYYCPRCQRN